MIQALAGVSAVRGEQLTQDMPTRLEDVFFGVPGVNTQQRADEPGMAVNIRGLQDFGRVAVVIDGARQNFQRTGHQADGLVYMEPELLAGVDVVRGPVANIYGSGAIGGVVSMRTLDSNDILKPGERFAALLHGMIGSNQVQGLGSAFVAARPVDNFDFMVGTTARNRTDFKDGNGNIVAQQPLPTSSPRSARVNVRPAEGHELKFGFINYEARYDNGMPNATHTATCTALTSPTRSRPAAGATRVPTTSCSISTSTPIGPRPRPTRPRSRAATARSAACWVAVGRSRSRRSASTRTTPRASRPAISGSPGPTAPTRSATGSTWSIRAAPATCSRRTASAPCPARSPSSG